MLIRLVLLGCVLGSAACAGEAQDCANDLRLVREAVVRDQNLAEEGRQAVEQLLRGAEQALAAGDQVICREMVEDAKELLGLDAAD